ncbi:MAG: hypothetical protein IV108_08100 [Burkholderiales bacterium]|mgnify:CR=1 FL=1|nr:hypothetical protein [Burkholderiales bacterium]
MKTITFAFAGLVLFSTWAHAGETLDAEAVKKLITGNTVDGLAPNGNTQKNYFSPDGKTIRQVGDKLIEGTWSIKEDGTQCVTGMPGGCAKIVSNGDGTYDRIAAEGKVLLRWVAVTKGKGF